MCKLPFGCVDSESVDWIDCLGDDSHSFGYCVDYVECAMNLDEIV